MSTHFLNGAFVSESELLISPRDLGYTRGFAVFDFLRTYTHHRPFKLKEHIDRLFNSASAINLSIPYSREELTAIVLDTLAKNDTPDEKFIKIIVSGGMSDSLLASERSTVMVLVDPATIYPSANYEKGLGALVVEHERYQPHAKTNNYIEAVKQGVRLKAMNADEPLYVSDGMVREASRSNVFAVIDGVLMTPKTQILEGITRAVLLEILPPNTPVVVEDFSLDDFKRASEAFFTGSGKEVTPLTSLDGKSVGDGLVGPVTKEVMRKLAEYTSSDLW